MQYNTTLSLAVAAHMLYNDSVKDELSPVSLAFYLIERDWMFSGEDEIYYVNSRGFIESFELEHRALDLRTLIFQRKIQMPRRRSHE